MVEREVRVMNYIYNRNTDSKGNHEVHTTTCNHASQSSNQVKIVGNFDSCKEAIKKAELQSGKTNFDGCYHCSYPCHKG